MTRVVLLGAGASRGTLGKCAPISKEFGSYLNTKLSSWINDYQYLKAAIQFLRWRIADTSLDNWALDKVWGAIDTRVKLQHIWELSLPGAPFPYVVKGINRNDWDPWGIAGFELVCLVARVYGENLEDEIKKAANGTGTVKAQLAELQPGDCVISFNYDLLAERILEELRKEWTRANRYYQPAQGDDKILLCKPHGCLSWKGYFLEKERPVEILNVPMPKRDILPDVHPCLTAPVPFKSEIIDWDLQLNKVPTFFHLLVAQWRFAIEHLSKADRLVVMGYGFPPEDLHAHHLFAEAAAKREKDGKLGIQVFEACEQRFNEVKTEIYRIFHPSRCSYSCEYKGAVIRG